VLAAFAVLALIAPVLVSERNVSVLDAHGPLLSPPSLRYPLGTDENGLSIVDLLIAGSRSSLVIGFASTALAVGVGVLVGLAAGYLSGWPPAALGWVTEWFLLLPQVPFAMVLAGVLPPGTAPLVLAIAVTSWAGVARVVRAATLTAKTAPHLDRIRALGASTWHQLREHLLPAVLPQVTAVATLTLANVVLAEATLAFLGLGDPGQPTWGTMLRQASVSGAVSAGAWWYLLFPGLAIAAVVFAAGACGRALETAAVAGAGTAPA
jgi:peptide/nickel transport system permease protein